MRQGVWGPLRAEKGPSGREGGTLVPYQQDETTTNTHGSWAQDPALQKGRSLADTLTAASLRHEQRTREAAARLLTLRICELINVCCFKLPCLWALVTQNWPKAVRPG